MNRSWPRRVSALLWAVVFLLNTAGDAFGLHPCPHHGAVPGEDHGPATAGAHHAGHAEHPEAPEPSRSHEGPCTCASACQMGVGADLPPVGPPVAFRPLLPAADRSASPWAAPPPTRFPPHFLPYGLAPPARA